MDGFSFYKHTRVALRVQPIAGIMRAVCEKFVVSPVELCSQRRQAHLVRPRHIAFWLCKELTWASFPEIGRMFGNRDHSTVIYGVNKIQAEVDAVTEIGLAALALKDKLRGEQ